MFTNNATYIAKAPAKIAVGKNTSEQILNLTHLINTNTKEWRLDYYTDNDGFLQTNRHRIKESTLNKQEKAKFDKEYTMCYAMVKKGHHIAYRKSTEGSFDVYIDGAPADLKKTKSHNNIVRSAKHATQKQGAKYVIFEFEEETKEIHSEIKVLQELNIEGWYFFSNDRSKIYAF